MQTISDYKNKFTISNYSPFTNVFTKPIWGGVSEDTAPATLTAMENTWYLRLVHTQNGESYPSSNTVYNVVDEYEKNLTNEGVFEFLTHHNILEEFEDAVSKL